MLAGRNSRRGVSRARTDVEVCADGRKCSSPANSRCAVAGGIRCWKTVEAEGFEPPVSGFRRRRPLRTGPHLDAQFQVSSYKFQVAGLGTWNLELISPGGRI